MAPLSAFLPLLLTSCAASTEYVAPPLPEAPPGLRLCTDASVPPIPGAAGTHLTKAQTIEALAEQRAIAFEKDRCAKAWDAFYTDLRKSLGGK
jgi:hypothetical protein